MGKLTEQDHAVLAKLNKVGAQADVMEGRLRELTAELSSLSTPHLHEVNAQVMLAVRALETVQDRVSRAMVVAQGL